MSDDWFASKVAPETDKDDGCHADEAKALKNYLDGKTNADQAARAITLPVEAESDPGYNPSRLWALLIDAMTELPSSAESKVIKLLQAIQSLPPADLTGKETANIEDGKVLWSDLPGFGHLWVDLDWQDWRRMVDESSPLQRNELRANRRKRASVEAQLVVERIDAITLAWGHDCICDALERSNAVLDIEVPATVEWFAIAAKRIWDEIPAENWALARERDLWKEGKKMTLERWSFWKERLAWVSEAKELDEGTRDAARRTITAMTAVEGRLVSLSEPTSAASLHLMGSPKG